MTACDAEFGLKEIKGQLVSEGIRWSPRWGVRLRWAAWW